METSTIVWSQFSDKEKATEKQSKTSRMANEGKPVKNINKNQLSFPARATCKRHPLLHENCQTMQQNPFKLKEDNPLPRNC